MNKPVAKEVSRAIKQRCLWIDQDDTVWVGTLETVEGQIPLDGRDLISLPSHENSLCTIPITR